MSACVCVCVLVGVLFYTISLNARTADSRDRDLPQHPAPSFYLLPPSTFSPAPNWLAISLIIMCTTPKNKWTNKLPPSLSPSALYLFPPFASFVLFPRSHRSSCFLIRNPFVSPPTSNRCPFLSLTFPSLTSLLPLPLSLISHCHHSPFPILAMPSCTLKSISFYSGFA